MAQDLAGRRVTTLAGRQINTSGLFTVAVVATGTPPVAPAPARVPPPGARRAGTGSGDRVTLRRVSLCEPGPGVAEVAVVLGRRDRAWAMTIRLEERQPGRWLCTHLHTV